MKQLIRPFSARPRLRFNARNTRSYYNTSWPASALRSDRAFTNARVKNAELSFSMISQSRHSRLPSISLCIAGSRICENCVIYFMRKDEETEIKEMVMSSEV